MNELTFIIAVLVKKEVLTVEEAVKVIKSYKEGITNGNLGEMITKVDTAFKTKVDEIETVDARTIMNLL